MSKNKKIDISNYNHKSSTNTEEFSRANNFESTNKKNTLEEEENKEEDYEDKNKKYKNKEFSYDLYQKMKKENEELKETIKNNEKKYNSELNKKTNEIKELKETIKNNEKKYNSELNKKTNEIKELKETIKNNEKKYNSELNKKANDIKELKETMKNNEKKYNSELNKKTNEIKELKQKIEKIEKEINKIKEDNHSIKEENDQLKESLESEKKNKLLYSNFIKENEIKIIKYKKIEEIINNKEKIIINEEEEKKNNSNNDNDINDNENNKKYGKVGLYNEELNCYMSSVIQILKNLNSFSFKFLKKKSEDSIINSLQKLISNLFYSKEKAVSILEFKKEFGQKYKRFEGRKNNDSTCFLIYLLQYLHKAFNQPNSIEKNEIICCNLGLNSSEKDELKKYIYKSGLKNNSFIYDLFYGHQINKIICTGCNYSQVSFQSFNMLDLPLLDEKNKFKSLEQCLNCYLITKDQKGIPGFDCSNCKKNLLSYLTHIIKLPQILIINLKRVGEKYIYCHEIEIPFTLKTNLIDKLNKINKTYELIGFINHYGNEVDGHNISYSKNYFDNKWYYFNDTTVQEVKGFPSTDKAFLLFYQLDEE